MKHLPFYLILISVVSFGQEAKEARQLIEVFLKSENYGNGELKIVSELNEIMVERELSPLIEKTYFENPRFKSENIQLTEQEKNIVLKSIRSQYVIKWNDGDFENLKLIEYSEIRSHLRKKDTRIDSNRVMMFSTPVFIRNGQIAIAYFMHLCCGNGGQANIWFYKKINGKWEKWIPISEGYF